MFKPTPPTRLLLASALLSAWSAMVQVPSTATLRGTIIDFKSKEPLAHVKVELRGQGGEVITDDRGRFELTQLPPGDVEIAVSTVGYSKLGQKLTIPAAPSIYAINQTDTQNHRLFDRRALAVTHALQRFPGARAQSVFGQEMDGSGYGSQR